MRRSALGWGLSVVALLAPGCVRTAATPPDADVLLFLDGFDADARHHDAWTYTGPDANLHHPDAVTWFPDTSPPSTAGSPDALPQTSVLPASIVVAYSGGTAFVSDVDGSAIYVVPLGDDLRRTIATRLALPSRSQPWRGVEDGSHRVHVLLRGIGGLATVEGDGLGGYAVTTRDVCAEPRGIAWRQSDDALLVACAEGLLVTLPASGGPILSSVRVEDDLRDVVIVLGRVFVSRFRSAEVLEVASDGTVVQRWTPPTQRAIDPLGDGTTSAEMAPHVAWRLVGDATRLWMLHQLQRTTAIPELATAASSGSSYGGGGIGAPAPCLRIVQTALTRIDLDTTPSATMQSSSLPMEPATDLVLGGTTLVFLGQRSMLVEADTGSLAGWFSCATGLGGRFPIAVPDALAYGLAGVTLEVSRGPLAISRDVERLVLDSRPIDAGRARFFRATRSGVSCASCHPEGGDDGHVWQHRPGIPLRTLSVRGHILASSPFHWEGDLPDFDALLSEVWHDRMGGDLLSPTSARDFRDWIDGLDAPRAPTEDAAAVARGRALFESADVGCSDCHAGAYFSDGTMRDVGTRGSFAVPVLRGLAYRAPYMHDGCAATLRDRLVGDVRCTGGDGHGHVSGLSATDVDDLVSYLRTL